MPIAGISLSLMAAGLYVLVALATFGAAAIARSNRQQAWHLRGWVILGLLFCLLVILRLYNVEEMLRAAMREYLHAGHAYEARRDFQRPVVAALILLISGIAGWWAYRFGRTLHGRRNIATAVALAAGFAMLLLIALRLISLHFIDVFLYGPAKLNWFGDIGLSLLVGAAALYYIKVVRA